MFDIGSNSVRFVAYEGPPRAPIPIYNEKWPISLGEIVRSHGLIDADSMAHLLDGIDRFVALAGYMRVAKIRAVATAAIREAANGTDFIHAAAARGLEIELLDGQQEAQAAAMGVLCCYPDAAGYVADLGGGSLELARLADGVISETSSLPLGTAKLAALSHEEWEDIAGQLDRAIAGPLERWENLYLVGGSWRAAAHFHQQINGHPLQILSRYAIPARDLAELLDEMADIDLANSIAAISPQRAAMMPAATRMLQILAAKLQPSRIISCPLGIREGLLMQGLDSETAGRDPLLDSAQFAGRRLSRGGFDGARLFAWMQPLFASFDEKDDARLRHAACLLADCAWHIHPDYRSAHALQIGLEGNFIGAGARERAMIARALWSAYGDSSNSRAILSQLARRKALRRADKWGLAIRLGMRIDGGTGMALDDCRIAIDDDALILRTPPGASALRGDSIASRLQQLARGFGRQARFADLD